MERYEDLITFVTDRPGHDRRYAMDSTRIGAELGWRPATSFDEGMNRTVTWYEENREWVSRIRSGAYREWIRKQYGPDGE